MIFGQAMKKIFRQLTSAPLNETGLVCLGPVGMYRAYSEARFDQELYEKLHKAVVKGDTTKVQGLLQKFTKDEAKDILNRHCSRNFVPFLIVAIRNRHKHLVQLLVDHYDVSVDQTDLKPPEDIDSATITEWTPVLECVLVGVPVILNIICQKVQDINIGYPIHWACKRTIQGETDMLNILLRNGAQINISDKWGYTPLIVACQYRSYDLVHFLLQYGADVNLCSLDGSTPLHHLIEGIDDCKKFIPKKEQLKKQLKVKAESDLDHWKSAEQTILRISKELLEHGMLQNPNKLGLTPIYLACLKACESIVAFLLDNLSANDTERANCFELLASTCLQKHGLTWKNKMENYLDTPHYFLNKAMMIRHSHNPPLWKYSKKDRLGTALHQLETQTIEALAAIKGNDNVLITELILARQRILEVESYNDYLLPFIGEFIDYRTDVQSHVLEKANEIRVDHVVFHLLNAFWLQRQSLVHPSSDTLEERIKWLDNVCRHVQFSGTDNISVFGAILDSIEEFYKCRNSKNAYMTSDTYLLLVNFFLCIVTNGFQRNEEFTDIKTLTMRFLPLRNNSNPNLYTSEYRRRSMRYGRFAPCGNLLHRICREIKSTFWHDAMLKVSNKSREGFAELLKALHACGEDVNGQNSKGQTPLHVFLCDNCFISYGDNVHTLEYVDFTEAAVRSLLLAGANPDLRDKSGGTTLHAATKGYALIFQLSHLRCFDLRELNSTIELLLKIGANPMASDSRGFTPLHVLMDAVFKEGNGYNPVLVSHSEDFDFAYNRQMFHEVVRTIQSYGGSAYATTNDGRSVFDMCKDDELLEKMSQDIPVISVHLILSRLAAAAIRNLRVQYQDKLPTRLINIVELRD